MRIRTAFCAIACFAFAGAACSHDDAGAEANLAPVLDGWSALTTTLRAAEGPGRGRANSGCAVGAVDGAGENASSLPLHCALHAPGARSGLSLMQFLDFLSALECRIDARTPTPELLKLELKHPCFANRAQFAARGKDTILVELKEEEVVAEAIERRLKVSVWDTSDHDFPRYLTFLHETRPEGFEVRLDDWKILVDLLRNEVHVQTVAGRNEFLSLKIRSQNGKAVWDVISLRAPPFAGSAPRSVRLWSYQGNPTEGFLTSSWQLRLEGETSAKGLVQDYCWGGEATCPVLGGPLLREESAARLGRRWAQKPESLLGLDFMFQNREAFAAAVLE